MPMNQEMRFCEFMKMFENKTSHAPATSENQVPVLTTKYQMLQSVAKTNKSNGNNLFEEPKSIKLPAVSDHSSSLSPDLKKLVKELPNLQKTISQMLTKLELIENNQMTLNTEVSLLLNTDKTKHVEEIETLEQTDNALLTQIYESSNESEEDNEQNKQEYETNNKQSPSKIVKKTKTKSDENEGEIASENSSSSPTNPSSNNYLYPAKLIIRTVEILNGHDDVGVEDFIRCVERAKSKCSQPDLLLGIILTEKIIENAKRAIRFISITTFEELFAALREHVSTGTSIFLCKMKLDNCYQNNDSVQVFNQRFHQIVDELKYAIQGEYTDFAERKTALQTEEKFAIQKYIKNLRNEIGSVVLRLRPNSICKAEVDALDAEMWILRKNRVRQTECCSFEEMRE